MVTNKVNKKQCEHLLSLELIKCFFSDKIEEIEIDLD